MTNCERMFEEMYFRLEGFVKHVNDNIDQINILDRRIEKIEKLIFNCVHEIPLKNCFACQNDINIKINALEKRMEELLVTARSHADYISDLYEERIKSERGLDCHISHLDNIIEKILDRIESQGDVTYMFFPKVTSTCIEQQVKEKAESKPFECPVCDGSGSWPHLLSRCL